MCLRDPHVKMFPEHLFSIFPMPHSSNAPIGLGSSSQHPYSACPWAPSPGLVLAYAHPQGTAWYLVLLQCPQLPCSWLDGCILFQSPWLQHPGSHAALESQNLPQILLSKLTSFVATSTLSTHSIL